MPSPPRAVADAVRDLSSLRDVRAVVADAVQRGRCTVPDLAAELTAGPNVGSVLFREALADVADGIRSAAEGDLKDLLVRSGLPMPLFNPSRLRRRHLRRQARRLVARIRRRGRSGLTRMAHSPEDHASTLARGRRMAKHQMIMLRFTPKQIRTEPAEVIADIRAALEGARGRPPLNLRTVPAAEAA